MSRRYKSMKTYIYARKRREYFRYSKSYDIMQKTLSDKGLEMYDKRKYGMKEYFTKKQEAIDNFKEERGLSNKTKVTIPNYLRDLIYSQAYYRDFDEVRASKKNIRQNILNIKTAINDGEEVYIVNGNVKTKSFEQLAKERLKAQFAKEGKEGKITPDDIEEEVQKIISEKEQDIKWLRQAQKYTVQEMRSGKQEFLDLLSEVNNNLKDQRNMINSYDRRAWIRREFFGYAS